MTPKRLCLDLDKAASLKHRFLFEPVRSAAPHLQEQDPHANLPLNDAAFYLVQFERRTSKSSISSAFQSQCEHQLEIGGYRLWSC